MLNFRDTEIKKKLEPLCMAIINSHEKKIIYDFGNDFCFQNELSAEVTKDSQIRQKVTDCCIWPDLYCR